MSSSPPEEAPVYHKSLTPESPRPIHVPSPANIPILENQIEPIFNLISSHTHPPYAARDLTQMDQDLAAAAAALSADIPQQSLDQNEPKTDGDGPVPTEDAASAPPEEDTDPDATAIMQPHEVAQNADSDVLNTDSLAPAVAITNPASHAENLSIPLQPDENAPPTASAQALQDDATMQDDAQMSGEQESSARQDVAGDGMQALLESLSVPRTVQPGPGASVTSPSEDAVASTTESQQPDEATEQNTMVPDANTNLPAGLPQRPTSQTAFQLNANTAVTHPLPAAPNAGFALGPPPGLATDTVPGTNGASSFPASVPPQSVGAPGVPAPGTSTAPGVALPPPPIANSGSDARYTAFLDEETVFTAENAWEKFPPGSRLFVGNLPTESVTKRDVWNIFERYGRLAQISIKQAYGFVQFMDLESCQRAMKAEQGGKLKERNMHLEVSKPPKASRNTQSSTDADRLRDRHRRNRSRSPERRRAQRSGQNRALPYSDFRDEPRRVRDDYRPGRSPSPRRRGDDYRPGRDRSPDRYHDGRRRSRSPQTRGGYGRRSPSPRRSTPRDDDLPLPKRAPRDVPDVQIISLEDLSRPFIEYVVAGFRTEGMRVDVLNMPRVSLDAVIRRQIVEGVLAVCKLSRKEEATGKLPLQVFDRSRGSQNVRFDEYDDLTVEIAAKLAARAKAAAVPSTPTYGASASTYVPPYLQQAQTAPNLPPALASNPQIAQLLSTMDPATLQQFMAANAQPGTPAQPGYPQQVQGQPDASALAGSMPQQQQHHAAQQQYSAPAYTYPQQTQASAQQQPAYGYPPSAYPAQHAPTSYQASYGNGAQDANQVQSIMQQLAGIQRKS